MGFWFSDWVRYDLPETTTDLPSNRNAWLCTSVEEKTVASPAPDKASIAMLVAPGVLGMS